MNSMAVTVNGHHRLLLSPMGVTINLNDGTARGGDADGDTIGSDIENVRGSMHDDALTGPCRQFTTWVTNCGVSAATTNWTVEGQGRTVRRRWR